MYITGIKKEKTQAVQAHIEQFWKHDINEHFWSSFIDAVQDSWEDKDEQTVYFEIRRSDCKENRSMLLTFGIENFEVAQDDE